MFYSFGSSEVLETCIVLARPYADVSRKRVNDLLTLGEVWRVRLHELQGETLMLGPCEEVPWVLDPTQREILAQRFGFRDAQNELTQPHQTIGSCKEEDDRIAIDAGWHLLSDREPRLAELANVLISQVTSTPPPRSPGSGSLPFMLGAIYINPLPSWSSHDVVECIIHELTHQMLWNDECRFGHHPDAQAAFALGDIIPTAILGAQKSINIAFSSIVVTAEVLSHRELFRASSGVHGSSENLAAQALSSANFIRRVDNIEEFTTERFWSILDVVESRIKELGGVRA